MLIGLLGYACGKPSHQTARERIAVADLRSREVMPPSRKNDGSGATTSRSYDSRAQYGAQHPFEHGDSPRNAIDCERTRPPAGAASIASMKHPGYWGRPSTV